MEVSTKTLVEKLCKIEDWPKWKWHMNLVFRSHDLCDIVYGIKPHPEGQQPASDAEIKALDEWKKEDGKAASLIASALSASVAELVLTCNSANEIWAKLCSRFEQSSTQRLNMLIEKFFRVERDPSEDISTHIARLQKLFVDLNEELSKNKENTLSERMLVGRILSTLGKEYDNFKDLWDCIQSGKQTLNLLIEKLCSIELREKQVSSVSGNTNNSAFAAQSTHQSKKLPDNVRKAENKVHVANNRMNRAKKKFPCRICHALGHWAAECPTKAEKNDKTAFLSCEASVVDNKCNMWICDSGASVHVAASCEYFTEYKSFPVPQEIKVGKRGSSMLAFGQGSIDVKVFVNGTYNEAKIDDVWYVPDAFGNLFSIKAAAKKGFSTLFDYNDVIIRNKNSNKIVATGVLDRELYVLNLKVVKPVQSVYVSTVIGSDTLQVYHERLAHQNKRHVKSFLKRMDIPFVDHNEEFCDGCAIGKMHRLPFKKRNCRATNVGDVIHADVNGPMKTTSLGGKHYFVCFKDDFSRFRRIFFLRHKSEVCQVLKQFLNEAKAQGHTIKTLRCDGGREFDNKSVSDLLAEYGIEQHITPPYTPQQNGAAERENRTIVEAARSMLNSSKLPENLWAEACNTAVYILNKSGNSLVSDKVPYQLWYKKDVGKLNHLKIFGTPCYVHLNKKFRSKFEDKAVLGYMVGYVNDKDGYRVYVPSKRDVICSHDVLFKPEMVCCKTSNKVLEQGVAPEENESQVELDLEVIPPDIQVEQEVLEAESSDEEEVELTEVRRSVRERRRPNWLSSGEFVNIANNELSLDPKSYSEAMQCSNKESWLEAMHEELKSLKEMNTWDLVARPPGIQVVQNKWVFRTKESDENEVRFKARLVAKGYVQKQGIDYDETFSPVARYDTVRTLLAVAAAKGLYMKQFDVKTAFLNGELEEEVFLKQPEGFEDGTNRVCRLKRSLYGLKQSPRCWGKRFRLFMLKNGFKVSTADPCLFIKRTGTTCLYVAIYVDDGLVLGTSDEVINEFVNKLQTEFKITIGSLNNFLGMQIKVNDDGSICVSQEIYIKKILQRFGMVDSNAVSTPASRDETESVEHVSENIPYREAVGCLMYLVAATRPDIAFAVNKAARTMDKPSEKDWQNVKRILRYLKGTSKFGIVYNKQQCNLTVFTDSDFAGEPNTRRSTTGIVSMVSGGAVSWTSQLQKTIALSTTEAELVASSEGAKELIWLNRLLSELTEASYSPYLYVDNASAVKLGKNPEYHKRSKHIDVRHFFVRERYLAGDFELEHIESGKQLADICTKPLDRTRYESLRNNIGIKCSPNLIAQPNVLGGVLKDNLKTAGLLSGNTGRLS